VRAYLTAQKEAVQTAANAQAYAAANAGMRGIAEALGTSLGNQIRAMDKHRMHQIRGSSDPRGSVTPVDTAVGLTVTKVCAGDTVEGTPADAVSREEEEKKPKRIRIHVHVYAYTYTYTYTRTYTRTHTSTYTYTV